jgi:hypothetical protein
VVEVEVEAQGGVFTACPTVSQSVYITTMAESTTVFEGGVRLQVYPKDTYHSIY